MKNKYTVISRDCLPTGSPLASLTCMYLLMDKFHAPEWAMAIYAVFAALTVLGWLIRKREESGKNLVGFGEGS